jgi:hypothetical protein
VDAERIGVTGISGGGAATFWVAAADERVKVAVPVSGMSDLESYVTDKVINGHCDCMFLVNTYQWDWTTIAALVAPRPLLFANSDNDKIFPMDGNRRIIAKLRRLYKMYDKPDLVDDYVSKGGHDYRPDLRVAIFQWINKHLKNDTGPVKDAEFKPLPGKDLRVFPEDRDVPKDTLNGKIDETFVKRAEVKLPEKEQFAEWKKGMLKELREKSFRGWPERVPKPEVPLLSQGTLLHWVSPYQPEKGIEISLDTFPSGETRPKHRTLFVSNEGSRTIPPAWTKPFLGERWYEEINYRGIGGTEWTRKSPPNYVERAHVLLGRTVDGGRVWDIIAGVRNDKDGITIIGRGQAGILAAYAALFEPKIKEVVIVDPPTSHKDGPIFLNVLRVLDIPDALGLLAPNVKLTLINGKDKAFDRTAQLYKLAGAEGNFERK